MVKSIISLSIILISFGCSKIDNKLIDLGLDNHGNNITMNCDDYSNNIKNGICSKYLNGKLYSTCNYVNDVEDGTLNIYENDVLLSTQQFKKGLKHGQTIIYKDSKPTIISNYENDMLEGISKTIVDGTLVEEVLYLHDEPKILKQYNNGILFVSTYFYPDNKEKVIKYSYNEKMNRNFVESISNYHNENFEGIQQTFEQEHLCTETWFDNIGNKVRYIEKHCLDDLGRYDMVIKDERY